MAAKIRKNDTVRVLAGKDKGKDGKVLHVFPDDRKVTIQGINLVKKHTRPSMQSEGGVVSKEMPLDVSNVALIDPTTGKPTRVGFVVNEAGKKQRVSKVSGTVLD